MALAFTPTPHAVLRVGVGMAWAQRIRWFDGAPTGVAFAFQPSDQVRTIRIHGAGSDPATGPRRGAARFSLRPGWQVERP